MEIKVREVSDVEAKSTQQVEQELLEKHEAEVSGETPEEQPAPAEEPEGLSEDAVRSFLSERYGREITSLDELAEVRSEAPELPEDVAAYYKFKQETGRGLNDFMKVNRNLDEADGDTLLKEYFLITEDGLDAEDVEMMMEDYKFDADLDWTLWRTLRSTNRTNNMLSRRRRTKRNRSAGKSGSTRRPMKFSQMDSKVLSSVSTTNPMCTLPVTALN
jgi:hypothetical protein